MIFLISGQYITSKYFTDVRFFIIKNHIIRVLQLINIYITLSKAIMKNITKLTIVTDIAHNRIFFLQKKKGKLLNKKI